MIADTLFQNLPLAVVYVITVAIVLLALGAGRILGRHYIARLGAEREPSIGSAVTATLGLLAFLLAFTFNMSADRYQKRKALLLDEVNAIHTAYLHADFLNAEDARRAQVLLKEYVDLRDFNPSKDPVTPQMLARSEAIQAALWELVDRQVAAGYDAGYLRQFVEPLTDLINFHNSRVVTGLEYRIPGPIWLALYFLTALAMLVIGFQFGVSRGGSMLVAVMLALTFATVILLISDLERATEGVIIVDQGPMSKLNALLHQSPMH